MVLTIVCEHFFFWSEFWNMFVANPSDLVEKKGQVILLSETSQL